ncbi:MAG: hypothetical protein IKR19_02655 [Acholeplasmatales bacterium]|nr:hypothetical protein [Acholeplasmatales bacterium]
MLELTYEKKVHLDKWDIDVVPYLTIEEMEHIINDLINSNNGLERDMKLVADILVACTTLYNTEEEVHYTYEDILYSGFWYDLLDACPILRTNIDTIYREVREFNSLNKSLVNLVDAATQKIEAIDASVLDFSKINLDDINHLVDNINKQLEK